MSFCFIFNRRDMTVPVGTSIAEALLWVKDNRPDRVITGIGLRDISMRVLLLEMGVEVKDLYDLEGYTLFGYPLRVVSMDELWDNDGEILTRTRKEEVDV